MKPSPRPQLSGLHHFNDSFPFRLRQSRKRSPLVFPSNSRWSRKNGWRHDTRHHRRLRPYLLGRSSHRFNLKQSHHRFADLHPQHLQLWPCGGTLVIVWRIAACDDLPVVFVGGLEACGINGKECEMCEVRTAPFVFQTWAEKRRVEVVQSAEGPIVERRWRASWMGHAAVIGFGLSEDGLGVRVACGDFDPGAVGVGQ